MTKALENPIINLEPQSANMIKKAYSVHLKNKKTKKQKKENTTWLYK